MNDDDETTCTNPNCSGHGKTNAQMLEDTMNTILKYGHQVIGIIDGDPHERITYSVGRAVAGKPEFVVTGPLSPNVAQYMINTAAKMMDEGLGVEDGFVFAPDTLITGFPVRVVAVDPDLYEMHLARDIFGGTIEALQLVWPDTNGHWPEQPGYDHRFTQPIHPLQGSST